MFVLAAENVHVLARQMIDTLLCFSVGRAGHWMTRHRQQGQAKDLQLQKVSVVGFSLELVLLRCFHVVVE